MSKLKPFPTRLNGILTNPPTKHFPNENHDPPALRACHFPDAERHGWGREQCLGQLLVGGNLTTRRPAGS